VWPINMCVQMKRHLTDSAKDMVCSCSVRQLFTNLQTVSDSVTIDVLHNIQTSVAYI
jgi:hypothetical protein